LLLRKKFEARGVATKVEKPSKHYCGGSANAHGLAGAACSSSLNPFISFFDFPVPVVQRIEQGFPKGKTAFLQEFADVISSAQTVVSEYLEQLLPSSRVISSLPIFRQPGDTKGDTKFPYHFASSSP